MQWTMFVAGRLARAIELRSYYVFNERTTRMAFQYLHVILVHGKTLECE